MSCGNLSQYQPQDQWISRPGVSSITGPFEAPNMIGGVSGSKAVLTVRFALSIPKNHVPKVTFSVPKPYQTKKLESGGTDDHKQPNLHQNIPDVLPG